MNIESERERLSQKKILEYLRRELKPTDMVTVSLIGGEASSIYCTLIPLVQIDQVRSKLHWEFQPGEGIPGSTIVDTGGEERAKYLRFGVDNGTEPLVIDRRFWGLRDDYQEISEEFRHFHNLYHDKQREQYIRFDDEGTEEIVAIVEQERIQIRLKEIRQFLAIKEMFLWIQFDFTKFSDHSLEELGPVECSGVQQEGLTTWDLDYGSAGSRAFSRFQGKQLVKPLPKSKSGFKDFVEKSERKYAEFIIDVDENGDEITHTSDPSLLANLFGANLEAPLFLTPVYFRKQVLEKYYQQPSKYSIEDSTLRCGGLWGLSIDNHHSDKICAWLGNLGRHLPYREQLHWQTYNTPPAGGVSKTFFRRQVLGQWAATDQPDLLFRERYQELKEEGISHLGWHILKPLTSGDEHHFQALRVPATDEQRDFDELVLSLTKILIDSLHVKRLNSLLSDEQKEGVGEGGIARLEAVLASRNVEGAAEHIAFLRKLQSLRSSSVAHRKGSKYRKIAKQFNIEDQNLRDVFVGILWQAIDFINFLVVLVAGGRIDNVEENKIEEGYAILSEMIGFVDSGATDGSVNHDDLIYE